MSQEFVRARENLSFWLEHAPGQRIVNEGLTPLAPPAQGRGLAFGYLGDMQLRLVFEQAAGELAAVRTEDLAKLELTPGKAVALGVVNLRAQRGQLAISELGAGVYVLRGPQQVRISSYFLERSFWRDQLRKFPQGLLAAMPRPGLLMFTPAGDASTEQELERQASRMLQRDRVIALSACIYRFGPTGWSVVKTLPAPEPAAPKSPEAVQAETLQAQQEEDLDKAAGGQKILVYSILLGMGLNGLAQSNPHPLVMLAVMLVLTIYSLWGVLRLSSGLCKSRGVTISFMVLSFFPLLNLVSWIYLSIHATRRLRAAGWRVGLLGARP